VNQTTKEIEAENFVSVFPQFAQYEDSDSSRQAGGLLSQSDLLSAGGRLGENEDPAYFASREIQHPMRVCVPVVSETNSREPMIT
jgi:hypothetical protein